MSDSAIKPDVAGPRLAVEPQIAGLAAERGDQQEAAVAWPVLIVSGARLTSRKSAKLDVQLKLAVADRNPLMLRAADAVPARDTPCFETFTVAAASATVGWVGCPTAGFVPCGTPPATGAGCLASIEGQLAIDQFVAADDSKANRP